MTEQELRRTAVIIPPTGRAVTSVRLLRTPLLRLGGVSLLIVAAPGAKLFLPAIPAPQAGLLAHILAEDAP